MAIRRDCRIRAAFARSAHGSKLHRKLTAMALMVAGALVVNVSIAASQPPTPRPLAANDLSILFPPQGNAKDLNNLIALSNLNGFFGHRAGLVGRGLQPVPGPSPKIRRRRSPGRVYRCDRRPKSSGSAPGSFWRRRRLTSMVIMGLALPEPSIFIVCRRSR